MSNSPQYPCIVRLGNRLVADNGEFSRLLKIRFNGNGEMTCTASSSIKRSAHQFWFLDSKGTLWVIGRRKSGDSALNKVAEALGVGCLKYEVRPPNQVSVSQLIQMIEGTATHEGNTDVAKYLRRTLAKRQKDEIVSSELLNTLNLW